ncbi:hypothetical protein DsansV1_C30g0214241 [Dioscorea sansibarensis]
MAIRTLISRLPSLLSSSRSLSLSSGSPFLRLRPLVALGDCIPTATFSGCVGARALSTRATTSSLNDPQPNWSNRPPKETILLDGCDFEHWLVVMEPPDPSLTRDEIIDYYVKTLAKVVGSEEEARMKLYSVSTKHYFAFGCLVSEELSYKIKALDKVRWVLPDSYLDVKNKDYGGEPVIDGVPVPYDPKYHEEWVRNNARANERSRRNDRPRDRSRNFERRRENIQSFQNRDASPMTPNMPPREPLNMAGMHGPGNQNPMPSSPGNYPPPSSDGRGLPSGPAPQGGGSQGFQGGPAGGNIPSGPGHAGPGPVYQGGSPGYQGGNRGYPGSSSGYQGGGSGYQGVNQGYPGNNSGYQGVNQGYPGNNSGYQGVNQAYPGNNSGHQGVNQGYPGNNPSHQGGGPGYQGGNQGNSGSYPGYQGGGTGYQGGNQGYRGNNPGYQGGNQGYQGGDEVTGRDHH